MNYKLITYVNGQTSLLKWAEGNDLLEEIKQVISTIRMREVGDWGVTRPGDNRYQEDTNKNRSSYTVDHQEYRKDTIAGYF